ncbi:MAG: hypothetical protein PHD70_08165 [Anaerostipes sp.]|nr:hypothetical protein [Anaerostipes sp.]MDD3746428.1 hypothetical protein [Anaerostipes sp.]
MKQKGVLAFRILGVATILLGLINTVSAVIYIVSGINTSDINLPTGLFYGYTVACLIFGIVEFLAGINAYRAYQRPEYRGICFKSGIAMIVMEAVVLTILYFGNIFTVQSLSGFVYPVIYVVLIKLCR